jgi:hypothetical protein
MKAKGKTVKPKPQTTIVHVAVTTAGPVPMKRVREWVLAELTNWSVVPEVKIIGDRITKVTVKRDANIERP